ncbi:MAG: hypothetical protein KGK03_04455 [Candidatus Omnitrophica bacterium]|nr:hypothetical protein [Candidatus Omnitrophota bacterium]MDE2222305.1 hypothetical protein [Candidatus Omnitrophota bacterium]
MPKKPVKKCCMCGKPVFSPKSIYCRDCSHFSARMSDERFSPETRQQLWNYVRRNKGFYCYYTGLKLDVFDYASPYFLEFDHVTPQNPKKIVMCCAWFNEIKGDMTLNELKGSVKQLFNYWFKGIKIKKRKFRYWYRLIPDFCK